MLHRMLNIVQPMCYIQLHRHMAPSKVESFIVLKKAPDLPEALYLKAQIIVEGYHKLDEDRLLLEKILTVLPERGETYHRWAQTMLDDINTEKDR